MKKTILGMIVFVSLLASSIAIADVSHLMMRGSLVNSPAAVSIASSSDPDMKVVGLILGSVVAVAAGTGIYFYYKNRVSDEELIQNAQNLKQMMFWYESSDLQDILAAKATKRDHKAAALVHSPILQSMSDTEWLIHSVSDLIACKTSLMFEKVVADYAMVQNTYNALWWRSMRVKSWYTDPAIAQWYEVMRQLRAQIKPVYELVLKHEPFFKGIQFAFRYTEISDLTGADLIGNIRAYSAKQFPLVDFVRQANEHVLWIDQLKSNIRLRTMYPYMVEVVMRALAVIQDLKQQVMATSEYAAEHEDAIKYEIKMRELAIEQSKAQAAMYQAQAVGWQAQAAMSKARTYKKDVDLKHQEQNNK